MKKPLLQNEPILPTPNCAVVGQASRPRSFDQSSRPYWLSAIGYWLFRSNPASGPGISRLRGIWAFFRSQAWCQDSAKSRAQAAGPSRRSPVADQPQRGAIFIASRLPRPPSKPQRGGMSVVTGAPTVRCRPEKSTRKSLTQFDFPATLPICSRVRCAN
jgi:hypothetical protein